MKKLLLTSSVLAIVTGIILILGGVGGIYFTATKVAQEKIVTPKDASIPEKAVLGPLTLKAQADSMREHVLKMTGGQTYSQMPRQIPQLDSKGKEVMVPNTARDTWVTYTALTTALNLGILTYAFSAMIVLIGFISVWTGMVFLALSKERR